MGQSWRRRRQQLVSWWLAVAIVAGGLDVVLPGMWLANGTLIRPADTAFVPDNMKMSTVQAVTIKAMRTKNTPTADRTARQAVLLAAAVQAAAALPATAPLPSAAPTAEANLAVAAPAPVSDDSNAFSADWYRCVIFPESSDRAHVVSGLFGILSSTWHDYGMPGVPGDYSSAVQAAVALRIYDRNGGFGPPAWNNRAGCGKSG